MSNFLSNMSILYTFFKDFFFVRKRQKYSSKCQIFCQIFYIHILDFFVRKKTEKHQEKTYKLYIFPQICNDFLPKEKFLGNEIS